MADQPSFPAFPNGIGVARLRVDATAAPADRLAGGAPHVHLASTEAYYVLAGAGSVQTLSAAGLRDFDLSPGAIAWFAPGVVHRLINADGKLEILLIGQNGDLSFGEDAILTFAADVMADAAKYAEAAAAEDAASATARRNSAVAVFNALRTDFQFKGKPALDKFYAAAGKLAKAKAPKWYTRWSAGTSAAANAASVHLNNLRHGHVGHLSAGRVGWLNPPDGGSAAVGLSGTLHVYQPEGSVA
jgi:mannose-6-phosphate isomerase-like protein (cupin superfamily)